MNPNIIFQLSRRGSKSVAKRDINILVFLFIVVVTTHHNLLVRNRDIDPDLIKVTVMLVMVLRLDRNSAADDVMAMLFQFCGLLSDTGFNRIGMLDAMESDF